MSFSAEKIADSGFGKKLSLLLSEAFRERFEKFTLILASVGFMLHVGLIYLKRLGFLDLSFMPEDLIASPVSAIYTPFSFILIFEVYLLVYYLPQSFTSSVLKQYEVIALVVIRKIFKDITYLDLDVFWFSDEHNLQLTYDLLNFVIIFFLIFLFKKLISKGGLQQDISGVRQFIRYKKYLSVLLSIILLCLAVFSLASWFFELNQYRLGLINQLSDINAVFYHDFFEVLILFDVLILLISLTYTQTYNRLIRNTGFIVSTVLIRLSFSSSGPINTFLIVSGVLFGVLTLLIFNNIEKVDSGDRR